MTYIRRKFLSLFCYYKVQIFRQLSVGQSSRQTYFKTFLICQRLGFKTLHWGVETQGCAPHRETGCPAPNYTAKIGKMGQSWIQSSEIQYANYKKGTQDFLIYICLTQNSLDVDVFSSTEWTGGRQDHLFAFICWPVTIPTSQRHIRKPFVDLRTFLPRPTDFHPRPTHCHHLADRTDDISCSSLQVLRRRPPGGRTGFKVSICHETNLLHLNQGSPP